MEPAATDVIMAINSTASAIESFHARWQTKTRRAFVRERTPRAADSIARKGDATNGDGARGQ